jgi:hypothetical protein
VYVCITHWFMSNLIKVWLRDRNKLCLFFLAKGRLSGTPFPFLASTDLRAARSLHQ